MILCMYFDLWSTEAGYLVLEDLFDFKEAEETACFFILFLVFFFFFFISWWGWDCVCEPEAEEEEEEDEPLLFFNFLFIRLMEAESNILTFLFLPIGGGVSLIISSFGFHPLRDPTTSCLYSLCNCGVVHSKSGSSAAVSRSINSLFVWSIINWDMNSSDTRILRVPDEVFWISKGEHELAAAFLRNAAFIFIMLALLSSMSWCWQELAKEAIVTKERTEWKRRVGRRK